MMKILLKSFIILIIIGSIAVSGYYYLQHKKYYPSTSDAYLQANTVQIAPRVSGMVEKVYVSNHEKVKKGQSLFDIDPTPYKIALNKATAELENAKQQMKAQEAAIVSAKSLVKQRQAELNTTQKNYLRTIAMVKQHLSSTASGDKATSDLQVAQAALAAAKSELVEAKEKLGQSGDANAQIQIAKDAVDQANLNLKYTRVVSPGNGYIAQLTLRKGQVVTSYQPLFVLIEDHSWWVDANYKETDLERVQPGQSVTVHVDMYPHHPFKGIVTNISQSSGNSFSVLPSENASGNWVKVTQRFPVKIHVINSDPEKYPLRLGASCTVTINTKSPA